MPKIYYAIQRNNSGEFIAGAGNSSLPTPRLYLTPKNAEEAVKRHWPEIARSGYQIVRFIMDSKWYYKNKTIKELR